MTIKEIIERTNHILSDVHEQEQEMWLKIISKLDKPLIVDFGTGHGKSASTLALANQNGFVYTFDPGFPYINAGCDEEQYEKETRKFIADSGAKNVKFYRVSSLNKEWGEQIDVLNIDSDHTYETTKAEIIRWVPFVKQGGLVFFHDWEHPRCPGIRQAVDELIPSKYNLKFQYATQSGAVKCAYFIKE